MSDETRSAQTLVERADAEAKAERNANAIRLYRKAIAAMRDSPEKAEALEKLCFAHFGIARKRIKTAQQHWQAAVDAYAAAIEIWRQGPHDADFASKLHNFAALTQRGADRSVVRAIPLYEEAIAILNKLEDPQGEERLATWNHLAACYIRAGRLDDAEKLLTEGLSLLPKTNQNRGFLLETQADLYEARAAAIRQEVSTTCTGMR